MLDTYSGSNMHVKQLISRILLGIMIWTVLSHALPSHYTAPVPLPTTSNSHSCLDLCQKCLNWTGPSSTGNQTSGGSLATAFGSSDRINVENTPGPEGERAEEAGGGEWRGAPTQQHHISARAAPDMRSPCMSDLLNHMSILQAELAKLDTKVASMLGNIGLRVTENKSKRGRR